MEMLLLAACLRSRDSYDVVHEYIDLKLSTYSKQFQVLMAKVGDYYKRDNDVENVDSSLLLGQIAETIRNEKHLGMFQAKLEEAMAADVSDANVRAMVLMAKQQEVGDKLSQALVQDASSPKVNEYLEELTKLRAMTSLDELEDEEIRVLSGATISVAGLINKELDPDNLIKLYPPALNDRLDGGAKRGHHITVFGRPEVAKSAFCITNSCGIANQGFKVLYGINEDREEDILLRHIYNLSNMSKYEVMNDPERAQSLAKSRGLDNIVVVSLSPGTPKQIEDLIDEHQPDCVIVDQLRNLKMRADNRVNQLEAAATACRTIAKKKNVLMISVTQAGDSADGKVVLEMGDIDFSNTGIPSQADVLIGIGMDATLEAEQRRMFSICKNKLSGRHEAFPVNLARHLSRYTNV
ncbi:hypothetical protein [Xanthomonas phage DES1]|nr:hypothetical protein [Xanthomonas phage DES1]